MRLWNILRAALALALFVALAAPVEAGPLKRLKAKRAGSCAAATSSCGSAVAASACR